MRSMELGGIGVERRRYAVEEIRFALARLYRGFVSWTSMYGELDEAEERERRERVDQLLEGLSRSYLPRSMWLADETREKIEDFTQKSRELRALLSAEVEEKGYERARKGMSRRVSKKLGPAKKQVDSALETELSGPRPSGWRIRRK
ncbi:hypothetical protein GBA63_07550 [Rubrobacter tropicus]|uniref:Uncharacterized protein n=1 Tax=Rubrobacter tropicus TaxID=2653851 RepID=A0A6G8Q7R3_9ACTN|nr:hypothetical protein [Rubrobacter tropicus]QIN82511.1 hypothetical protein GBA63_07550 [Rubrobacter tropicus]